MVRRYMRPKEIAEEFGVSVDHVRDVVRFIRANTGSRYSRQDLIGTGRVVSIRTAAYMDAESMDGSYRPLEVEQQLGLAPTWSLEDVADEVIRRIKERI